MLADQPLCPTCKNEFGENSLVFGCHRCGPKVELCTLKPGIVSFDMHSMLDEVDAVCGLLQKGELVAIQGLGTIHLACDAANETAVEWLCRRVTPPTHLLPFLVRDEEILKKFAHVSRKEKNLLANRTVAELVLPWRKDNQCSNHNFPFSEGIFSLPQNGIELLIMLRMNRPIIFFPLTVGEVGKPLVKETLKAELKGMAEFALLNTAPVLRGAHPPSRQVNGNNKPSLSSRGGARFQTIKLPEGFEASAPGLALGSDSNPAFCVLDQGQAYLTHPFGATSTPPWTQDDAGSLKKHMQFFSPQPTFITHSLSSFPLREQSFLTKKPQHISPTHGLIASAMVAHDIQLKNSQVLAVQLAETGIQEKNRAQNDHQPICESGFFTATYENFEQSGVFKPMAMLDPVTHQRTPLEDLYAHLMAEMGWPRFAMNFQDLELYNRFQTLDQSGIDEFLKSAGKNHSAAALNRMVAAFCAALGDDHQTTTPIEAIYQKGINLLVERAQTSSMLGARGEEMAYPFAIPNLPQTNLPYIEPLAMWQAVLGDLLLNTPKPVMAARFINGLAKVIAKMALKLASANQDAAPLPIILTDPAFENQHFYQLVSTHLASKGAGLFAPPNRRLNVTDLAIGQVAIGAAQQQKQHSQKTKANHRN